MVPGAGEEVREKCFTPKYGFSLPEVGGAAEQSGCAGQMAPTWTEGAGHRAQWVASAEPSSLREPVVASAGPGLVGLALGWSGGHQPTRKEPASSPSPLSCMNPQDSNSGSVTVAGDSQLGGGGANPTLSSQ